MDYLVVDPNSIEEDEEGIPSIKVFTLVAAPFPDEIVFQDYYWDYVGGGFLTMVEAQQYDSKATYKLRVRQKSESRESDPGFQLY